jgi:hypothetical protein
MDGYTALCSYRVKEGKDKEFRQYLVKHWPTLLQLGLVTSEPSLMFRVPDESGKSVLIEILRWKSKEGPSLAEQMPDVLAIWERMGGMVEARLGRPAMEFPFVEQIDRQ